MPKHQPRKSHYEWQLLIKEFRKQTELTQQQFCESQQISLGTFRKWLYKPTELNTGATGADQRTAKQITKHPASGFEAVSLHHSNLSVSGCCLELPGNVRLHTQSLPSIEYLQNLVKVLGYGH